MTYLSHRIKVEEKKVYRKLILTFVVLISIGLFLVFAGLPLLARTILFFTSFKTDKSNLTTNNSSILFPPSLNPIFEATNTAKIIISGYGEKEAAIKIIVNGREQVKATSDAEGKFTAININLTEGENIIKAVNIKDNKESTTSSPITVIYKKTLPKLEIEKPTDGDKFSGDQQNISIIGTTDQGNRLIINERMAIIDPQGKFNFPYKLAEGDNNLKITALDNAGNQSIKELKVNYRKD
jgi:uncharacterized protein YfaP (DUF2135 family)